MPVNMRNLCQETVGWGSTKEKLSSWASAHGTTLAKGCEFAYSHDSYLKALDTNRAWKEKEFEKQEEEIKKAKDSKSSLRLIRQTKKVISQYENKQDDRFEEQISWLAKKGKTRNEESLALDDEFLEKSKEFSLFLDQELGKENSKKISNEIISKAKILGNKGIEKENYDNVFNQQLLEKQFSLSKDLSKEVSNFFFNAYVNRFLSNSYKAMGEYFQKQISYEKQDKEPDFVKNAKALYLKAKKQHITSFEKDLDVNDYLEANFNQWSKDDVLKNANCYAYAVNDAKNHQSSPNPGEKSGIDLQSLSGVHVMNQAEKDGLVLSLSQEPKDIAGFYLVALVCATKGDEDYHWYRKGKDGFWTHKIGGRVPKGEDESREKIIDPLIADRGRYDDFVGFMYVPSGGIEVGKKAKPKQDEYEKQKEQRKAQAVDLSEVEGVDNIKNILGENTQERFILTSAINSIENNGAIDEKTFARKLVNSDYNKKPKEKHSLERKITNKEFLAYNKAVKAFSKGDENTQKRIFSLKAYKNISKTFQKQNIYNKQLGLKQR